MVRCSTHDFGCINITSTYNQLFLTYGNKCIPVCVPLINLRLTQFTLWKYSNSKPPLIIFPTGNTLNGVRKQLRFAVNSNVRFITFDVWHSTQKRSIFFNIFFCSFHKYKGSLHSTNFANCSIRTIKKIGVEH